MDESRHAQALRSLGFDTVPDLTMTRAQKAKRPPSFTIAPTGNFTFATDETGQSWMAAGAVDLAHLSFNNTSKQ